MKTDKDKKQRYSADLDEIMDHKKNRIIGLESNTSEKSNFRSAQQLSSYE